MDKKQLEALAQKAAKYTKTKNSLISRQMLTKVTTEIALSAELSGPLGYYNNAQSLTNNKPNGYYTKSLKVEGNQTSFDITQNHKTTKPILSQTPVKNTSRVYYR